MWQPFFPLARQAINQPREAASELINMGVPQAALWPAFGLFVILSAMLGSASELMRPTVQGLAVSPVPFAVISGLAGAASVFAIWKVGQAMEGVGTFRNTLLLLVFLQGILFIGQVVEFALFVIAPPISALFSMALLIFAFWLNLNFIAALHGFSSLWRALGCLLMASAAVALLLIAAMTLFGVTMIGTPSNV